ncbi:MAG: alginate export family protein [Ignavibacteriaceae bacterium]
MYKFLIIIFVVVFTSSSFAQDEWKFSGQLQLRTELDGRDFSHDTHALTFASMRTRVGVEKTFMDKVNFFVQIQDSRVFGEETNTLASIDNIDLHQGYVTLKELFDWDMDVQAGRFEVVYGTERFFGSVGWHYVGRSWDGVRLKFYPGFKLDVFALTHTESVPYIGNAVPALYPLNQTPTPAYSVYGIWESGVIDAQNQLDLFGYYEVNRQKITGTDDFVIDRFTIGANHFGKYGNLSTIAEAAYQFGKVGIIDVSAYLVSLQASYKAENWKLGAGADILSGRDYADNYNVFSPSFGTNHKFYGFMDYFINIPQNTSDLGLHDFYLNASFAPNDSKFSASLDLHHFSTDQSLFITSEFSPDGEEESSLGQEIDLTVKYNFIQGTSLTWGGSAFIPGKIMKAFFSGRGDVGFWSYLMVTANL